jgi:hypothetical protein
MCCWVVSPPARCSGGPRFKSSSRSWDTLSFPQSLQAVSGMVSWVRSHPLSFSLFPVHIHSWRLTIWCYIILSTESVVKQIQNIDVLSSVTDFRLGFCSDTNQLPQTWLSLLQAQWLLCIPPGWAFEKLCFHHILYFYMLCIFTGNSFHHPILGCVYDGDTKCCVW